MKRVIYKVSLKGLGTPSGAISFSTLRKVLEALHEGSERALRLAIEGESVRTGPIPDWLAKSAEFILTGIHKGSTTLTFEAPTLREVAKEQIQQQDLWYTVPKPEDTALSILVKSISDVQKEKLESERYDAGVLESLLMFKQIMGDHKVRIMLSAPRRRAERFVLDNTSFETIEDIRQKTPDPQAVLLTGFFNAIEHSHGKFQITLENGQTVRGRVKEGGVSLEEMRKLWGKKVTIKGIMCFMPTKKPRFLEAEIIQPRRVGDEAFTTLTLPLSNQKISSQVASEKVREGIVSDIWGKWPGEETTEEILEALKEPTPDA